MLTLHATPRTGQRHPIIGPGVVERVLGAGIIAVNIRVSRSKSHIVITRISGELHVRIIVVGIDLEADILGCGNLLLLQVVQLLLGLLGTFGLDLGLLLLRQRLQRVDQRIDLILAFGLRLRIRLLQFRHGVDRILQRVNVALAIGLRLKIRFLQRWHLFDGRLQRVSLGLAADTGLKIRLLQGRNLRQHARDLIRFDHDRRTIGSELNLMLAVRQLFDYLLQLFRIGLTVPNGCQQHCLGLFTRLIREQVRHAFDDVGKGLLSLQRLNADLSANLLRSHQHAIVQPVDGILGHTGITRLIVEIIGQFPLLGDHIIGTRTLGDHGRQIIVGTRSKRSQNVGSSTAGLGSKVEIPLLVIPNPLPLPMKLLHLLDAGLHLFKRLIVGAGRGSKLDGRIPLGTQLLGKGADHGRVTILLLGVGQQPVRNGLVALPLIEQRLHVVGVLLGCGGLLLQGFGLLLTELLQTLTGDLRGLRLFGQRGSHRSDTTGGRRLRADASAFDLLQRLDVLIVFLRGTGSRLGRLILVLTQSRQRVGHVIEIPRRHLTKFELVNEITGRAERLLGFGTEIIQTVLQLIQRGSLSRQRHRSGVSGLIERFDLALALGHMLRIRAERRTRNRQPGGQRDARRAAEHAQQYGTGVGGDGLQSAQCILRRGHVRTYVPDTLRGGGGRAAQHDGALGGETGLGTGLGDGGSGLLRLGGHIVHALGGRREQSGHVTIHGGIARQRCGGIVPLQLCHRGQQLGELHLRAISRNTQLAQRVLIVHRVLDGLQRAGLQRGPRAHAGTAERRPQAQHALNRSGELRHRLGHKTGHIRNGLDGRSRGLQRIGERTAKRLGQLARHANQIGEHRRSRRNRGHDHAQPVTHVLGERKDATGRSGAQLGHVGDEITRQLPKIRHHPGHVGTHLVRRVADIVERVTHALLGVTRTGHPSVQSILSAHGVHGTVRLLQHGAELFQPVLILRQRSERTLQNALQRPQGRPKITGLLLDCGHGRIHAVGIVHHVLGPLGEPFGILAEPLRELRQILAAHHAHMGQGGDKRLHAGNEIIHRSVHTVEDGWKLIRIIRRLDGLHQPFDDLALMLGERAHLRYEGIADQVRGLHDGGLGHAIERLLHATGQFGKLSIGEINVLSPSGALVTVDHLERRIHGGHAGQRGRQHIRGLRQAHDALAQTADRTGKIDGPGADIGKDRGHHRKTRHLLIQRVHQVHEVLETVLHTLQTGRAIRHAVENLTHVRSAEPCENIHGTGTGEIGEMGAGHRSLQIDIHVKGVVLLLEPLQLLLGMLLVDMQFGRNLRVRIVLQLGRILAHRRLDLRIFGLQTHRHVKTPMADLGHLTANRFSPIQIHADTDLLVLPLGYLGTDLLEIPLHVIPDDGVRVLLQPRLIIGQLPFQFTQTRLQLDRHLNAVELQLFHLPTDLLEIIRIEPDTRIIVKTIAVLGENVRKVLLELRTIQPHLLGDDRVLLQPGDTLIHLGQRLDGLLILVKVEPVGIVPLQRGHIAGKGFTDLPVRFDELFGLPALTVPTLTSAHLIEAQPLVGLLGESLTFKLRLLLLGDKVLDVRAAIDGLLPEPLTVGALR